MLDFHYTSARHWRTFVHLATQLRALQLDFAFALAATTIALLKRPQVQTRITVLFLPFFSIDTRVARMPCTTRANDALKLLPIVFTCTFAHKYRIANGIDQ
jgi:hypothetical protein